MAADSIDDDPRAELARVERQIEELQQTVRDLRAGLDDAGPIEPEDRSAVIYEAEQQQEIIADLERRRDRLREQVGPS